MKTFLFYDTSFITDSFFNTMTFKYNKLQQIPQCHLNNINISAVNCLFFKSQDRF